MMEERWGGGGVEFYLIVDKQVTVLTFALTKSSFKISRETKSSVSYFTFFVRSSKAVHPGERHLVTLHFQVSW